MCFLFIWRVHCSPPAHVHAAHVHAAHGLHAHALHVHATEAHRLHAWLGWLPNVWLLEARFLAHAHGRLAPSLGSLAPALGTLAPATIWVVGRGWHWLRIIHALAVLLVESLTLFALSLAHALAVILIDRPETVAALSLSQGALRRSRNAGEELCDLLLGNALARLTWVKSGAPWALDFALLAGEAVARVWVLVHAFRALDLLNALLLTVGVALKVSLNIDIDASAVGNIEHLSVSALGVALALALLLVKDEIKVLGLAGLLGQYAFIWLASVESLNFSDGGALAELTWVKSGTIWALFLALELGEAVARVWVLVEVLWADKLGAFFTENVTGASLTTVVVTFEVALDVDVDALAANLIFLLTVSALKLALASACLLIEDEVWILSLAGLLGLCAFFSLARVEIPDLSGVDTLAVLTWVKGLAVRALFLALELREAVA